MLRRAQIISTLLELAGIAALVVGVSLISTPAAFIVGGVALVVMGYAIGTESDA